MGLKGLNQKLADMKSYLEKVAAGELPMNHEITYQLQDIFNLLPDVTNPCFTRSLQVNKYNLRNIVQDMIVSVFR